MEITGRLVKVLPEITGQGRNGQWRKQSFVIEIPGEYPKKVCITTWGEKIRLADYKINDELTVSFDLESREYNDRWFTDVKAWKIECKSHSGGNMPSHDDLPPDFPPPSADLEPAEDDLPF